MPILSRTRGSTSVVAAAWLVCCMAAPHAAEAQAEEAVKPFGLRMGMTTEELARVGRLEPMSDSTHYLISVVPEPHDTFAQYIVVVSPSRGLCKVAAISLTVVTQVDGVEMVRLFKAIERGLEARFGKHRLYDRVQQNSQLRAPKYWMLSLLRKERVLYALWSSETKARLGPDVHGVVLTANPLSQDSGVVTVAYEFANFEGCVG